MRVIPSFMSATWKLMAQPLVREAEIGQKLLLVNRSENLDGSLLRSLCPRRSGRPQFRCRCGWPRRSPESVAGAPCEDPGCPVHRPGPHRKPIRVSQVREPYGCGTRRRRSPWRGRFGHDLFSFSPRHHDAKNATPEIQPSLAWTVASDQHHCRLRLLPDHARFGRPPRQRLRASRPVFTHVSARRPLCEWCESEDHQT